MLHWDTVWKMHEHKLESFEPEQRAPRALICLKKVFDEYESYFSRALGEHQRCLVHSTLYAVMNCDSILDSHSEKLHEIVERPLPEGVWDIVMGLLHLIDNRDEFKSDDALEVMSFAYQAVLNIEVLSKLDKEMRGDEVRELELINSACARTLKNQLDFLDKLK